ncbi:MAG: ABC transporter permease [Oscillospiraceae bacterium]|nr:ABC transporter permease [Oscillospiraceae bacterium]
MLSIKMALRSIGANKMRAALTMLGIIIGVMALVVLVSLVTSTTETVTNEVSSLGSSLLTVVVNDDKGETVHLADLRGWVDEQPAVGAVAPYARDSITGRFGSESGTFSVYGTTPDFHDINAQKLLRGRYLKNTDVANASRVCVLDETTAENLIGYSDCVGEKITLNGVKYTVIGVVENDKSISITSLFSGTAYTAYVPFTSLIRLSETATTAINAFYIGAAEGFSVDDAEKAMKDVLNRRFNDDEDAYTISSQNLIEEAMNSITNVLTILLGGIAAISLIVGGIGIMNIMLVTVTERTREIGIRKAIGASRSTILRQFLIEAVVLCMFGCALGIFISWAILQIISIITANTALVFHLQGRVVGLSVLFCFIIGVVFGLYPANKAAKMKPIDALHYGG